MTVNLAPNPVSGPIPSGPKGDPGLVPAGEWAAGTYLANRMVRRFNCLFRSKRTTTQAPTFGVGDVVSSDDWELLIDGRGIELVTDNAQAAVQSATDAAASATEAQTYRDEMAPGEPGGTAQLDGGGVVPLEQIPASIRQKLGYKGGWDASTNTPAIPAASADNQGWYYVVAVAGSTTIDGISEWKVGDWIVSNGASWDRLEDTRVHTVAGRMGDVTLTSADLTDKGAAGGVAQLDGSGRVPVGQMPDLDNYMTLAFGVAPTKLENIAHRGFAGLAPENTMTAFSGAAARGASIETDVQISSDGVPVLIHDSTVDRTTNGTGNVKDLSLSTLRALDAGSKFASKFASTKIPTFDEYVAFGVTHSAMMYPEVKGYRTQADIDLMLAVAQAHQADRLIVWQSFNLSDLQYIRARNKKVGVGLLGSDISQLGAMAALGGRAFLLLDYTTVLANPSWVATARSAGVDVAVWTVDSAQNVNALLGIGVSKIMSNFWMGSGV